MTCGGREYALRYEILELVEAGLLVLRSDHTVARVELADEGGRTRVTLTDRPYPERDAGGASQGWNGAFDKLATLLGSS